MTLEETPPAAGEMERRLRAVLERQLPYLIAELGGRTVGFAYADIYNPRTRYRFTVENSVYVDKAHLKNGAGGQLLKELIARCTALGYKRMIAVIGDSTNQASRRLHASHGFRHIGTGERLGLEFGRWFDVDYMQKDLDPAASG